MTDTKKKKKDSFEESLQRLEGIVGKLESESTELEESLALFEEGVGLAKGLTHTLEEVKQRIQVVTKDAEGRLKLKPLEEEKA
jgi:exodeoxyribonuclease VII small subunit